MRRTEYAALASLLLLSGCHRSPLPEPVEKEVVASSALERAALAAGIIADASKISPVGLYQRPHEAGRDSLCLIPGEGARYGFGMEAIFGTEQYCKGHGTARRVGDKLILHFSGRSRCLIVARYDGDRIALPGVVDIKCADLCSERGSLEGVTFPRISSEPGMALAVRNRDGEEMCGE
jgi:hypothetical protein